MSQHAAPAIEAQDETGHFGPGFGVGLVGRIIFAAAIAFSAFQLYTAAFSPLPSQVVRSVHVGFLLLLTFSLSANAYKRGSAPFVRDWVLALVAFVAGFYHWVEHDALIIRSGTPTPMDIGMSVLMVALVFEAGRRMIGVALPFICALFLAYGLFGQYLPSPLNHRGFAFEQVMDQLFLGTEGIYGTPTYVSSSYIFLFILFGSFLERAGMIQLFNDLAMGTVGHARGGPAKVSVISSALMGTINGSGVANVVTTGQFTIPLMKRFGFKPAFAGAVEATSSMGGQIMPPVMGAVAFIMAETLGIAYIEVVKAAIVPAMLYFATTFWMVHLEAGRLNLIGLPKSECPDAMAAIRRSWYLILPLVALVTLLFSGYTPLFAGTIGLGLTAVVILGLTAARLLGGTGGRIVFWVALGLAAAGALELGVQVVRVVICAVLLLIILNIWAKGGRETLTNCRDALADGAKNALGVGVACALVGVIIGIMTLTGAASNFARFVVAIGQDSLFLSLVLTMITCLVLGMGIPTIPNYIITSSLAGPALLDLGVPLLVTHMFVFYFGIMADLTPPVALAAFAAAPIAKESGMRISINCLRIAIAGFVVPFMAVYAPVLMLQDGGPVAEAMGYWPAAIYTITKALIAIGLWGAASIGFLLRPMLWAERIAATLAAGLLVAALPISDEAGLTLAALVIAAHWWRTRRAAVSR
jgi:TRAP transporter 4TM/12TM fusion protein